MKFRFANPEDAAPFAKWATENQDIPEKDIEAARKENNPTATVLVIEDEDGSPILYVPIYCSIMVAYLGFNPEANRLQRVEAMGAMLKALKGFAAAFGINELSVLSKKEYAVAKWAENNGFEPETRQLFTVKVKEA
jgi:hypothetical protein